MLDALTGSELPTVLIVDDERLNRSMLAELLSPHYRVLLAKDGPGALVIAQREAHRLQLILLDLAMPGMNGYEVLGALRAQERTAHIAVIFITGQSNAQAEEYGLRLGAADYVSKPIRPAVVEVRVRNQIRLALQRQALERLTFRFVSAGFVLLTATLAAGWLFGEQLYGKAWVWNHKSVFSLLSWLTFAVLLIGRARFGWRGRSAVRMLYAGALLLLLAYAGSRFVMEVLLERAA